jgi:hypothetical protein
MNLEGCQMTRLESRASLGTPDILVAWREGIFSTIETKVVKSGLKVALSAHQVSWHMRTAEMGCPAHLIVAALEAAKRPATLKVYRAGQARELALHGLRVEPAAAFPLSHVPWHVLRDCLLS